MSGVSYIKENLDSHPKCCHGPTLLFQRLVNNKPKRFFACSACRDRKDCSFFLWQDEKHREKQEKWNKRSKIYTKDVNHRNLYQTFTQVLTSSESQRVYCQDCEEFELPKHQIRHEAHTLAVGLKDFDLKHPSEFLKPLENSKKEAQYLFSPNSVEIIVGILKKLGCKYILCIGAPRIHEFIINSCEGELESLLLDFDKRYLNFYSRLQFCWYNVFNHHFFLSNSKQIYRDFLQRGCENGKKCEIAIITDPPFGGRVEPIAQTLETIISDVKSFKMAKTKEMPIFWAFPYFMEPQIQNTLPHFAMLDYKVEYENHPLFRNGPTARKFGSPVRLFTNVNLSLIDLSEVEGYKKCLPCNRWVSEENKHCNLCNSCTSKDGRTYVHCNVCERCVKPSWKHCSKCARCAQPDHNCNLKLNNAQECFHCKKPGHKKRECPEVDHEKLRIKRMKGLKDEKHNNGRKKLKTSKLGTKAE